MWRRVSVNATIDQPVNRVFAYLAEPTSWHEFVPAVALRRRTDSGAVGIGSTGEAIDRIGPFKVRFTDELAVMEPGHRVVWLSSSPWNARTEYVLEPAGGGTRVRAPYEGDIGSWLRLLAWLPGPVVAKILEQDFRRLRRVLAAERPGRGRSATLRRVQRVSTKAELLDGPLDDPAALRGNLRDLSRANRWFGGARLSCRAVDTLLGGVNEASILDVGTGAADIPLALLDTARRRGQRRRVTAVDSRSEIIAAARTASPSLLSIPDLVMEVADGRSLPYDDRAFHVSHASLVLHHLEPADAVAFLRELARVARIGVVANDLVRSRLTLAGAWLTSRLFTTNRYTRHDAPLSARRAYSQAELGDLLDAAGLRVVAEFDGLAGHRRALAAVRA